MTIRRIGPPLPAPEVIFDAVTDPIEMERNRLQHEQAVRNMDWLENHWADILPDALGKFVAVAGQEAFVAETAEEAIARAEAAHPEDKGVSIHYLQPEKGPRIYANRLHVERC